MCLVFTGNQFIEKRRRAVRWGEYQSFVTNKETISKCDIIQSAEHRFRNVRTKEILPVDVPLTTFTPQESSGKFFIFWCSRVWVDSCLAWCCISLFWCLLHCDCLYCLSFFFLELCSCHAFSVSCGLKGVVFFVVIVEVCSLLFLYFEPVWITGAWWDRELLLQHWSLH